jgi:hypothetical protein
MLTEGELDTLLCRQELGDRVQAVTFGGCQDRVPEHLLSLLAQRVVMVGFDADDAGDAGFERIRDTLPNARRIRPTHGKDLTEQHAATGLRTWFDQFLPAPSPTLQPPAELSEEQIRVLLRLWYATEPPTRTTIATMHYPKIDVRPEALRTLKQRGLLRETKRRISLTPAGRELSETIRREQGIVTKRVTVRCTAAGAVVVEEESSGWRI